MIIVGRLIDGTEIIGELLEETDNSLVLKTPLQIVYKHSQTTDLPVVSFIKFMMFADQEKFDFQKVDFIVVAPTFPEMEEVYDKYVQMYTRRSEAPVPTEAELKSKIYEALLQSLEAENMTKQ